MLRAPRVVPPSGAQEAIGRVRDISSASPSVEGFSEVHIQNRECTGPNTSEFSPAGTPYRAGPMHLVTLVDRYAGSWIAPDPEILCACTSITVYAYTGQGVGPRLSPNTRHHRPGP
jgi:hypothetical protein